MTAKRPKPARKPARTRPTGRPIPAPETAPDDTPAYLAEWSAALVRAAPRRAVLALADEYREIARNPNVPAIARRIARRRATAIRNRLAGKHIS
jgi:hypothetical protein